MSKKYKDSVSMKLLSSIIVVIIIIIGVAVFSLYYGSKQKLSTSTTIQTTSSSSSLPPQTITVFMYSGGGANFLNKTVIPMFEKQYPNIKVQLITVPYSQYFSAVSTAFQANSTQYDIVLYTHGTAYQFWPYLLPLNNSGINVSDLLNGAMADGGYYYNPTNGKNEMVGILFGSSFYILAYNTKLFNNTQLQQEFYNEYHFSLNPWTWKNWTQVLDVDQFFVSHNITKYGFLIADSASGNDIDYAYTAVYYWYYENNKTVSNGLPSGLPNWGIYFYGINSTGKFPMIALNTSVGIQALITYKELVNYEPNPLQLPVGYDNLPDLIAQNISPGAFMWNSQIDAIPKNYSKYLAFAPLPGGYAEPGPTFLGISKFSTHVKAAELFLQFLVSPQVQVLSSVPVSKIAFEQIISNTSIPYLIRERYNATLIASQKAYAGVGTGVPSQIPTLTTYLVDGIFSYLSNQTNNPQEVMNTITQKWINALQAYYS
ncbi:ABC-type sugar transport system, periplasmic component [Caldisphaera lagunensis DSM 15908]|uniref:ABC-type sugar transport system, periplasmic component n=1 Tax=Caldisphaera lagunensis (strain DSM 15908 / JCM 11604 / ANMR 0165 / IC-154) TaxID=1056495 RepID=L0ABJ4_CALLD|nr:extracellular solute-binding protein [Caldisphaera lagunensis]AFZ70794.1 ABC-type sugar transport system, periplasmic component [Caldisphaera lagunensis DSM 15908]